MWQSDYQYYASLMSQGGEAIGDVHLDVDWVPALRWTELETHVNDASMPGDGAGRPVIEPQWSRRGPPFIRGVRFRSNGSEPVQFPLTYFSGAASSAAAKLVESGDLASGELFDYRIFALRTPADHDDEKPGIAPTVETIPRVDAAELGPLLARAETRVPKNAADTAASADESGRTMPVLIPERVLDEATVKAREAGEIETGGILVGRLCRDPDGTLFAQVNAQIPAEHTVASRETLRFMPATWVSVDAAIRLRGLGEIVLGWWHHHPFFCSKCPPASRAVCPFSSPTFSSDDRHLHREVFQGAWNVALLLSFLGEPRPSYDLFAWNLGRIEAVGFYSLPDRAARKEESDE